MGWPVGSANTNSKAHTYCLYRVDADLEFTSPAFEDNAVGDCAYLPDGALTDDDVGVFFTDVPAGEYIIAWVREEDQRTGQTTNSLTYDPVMDQSVDGALADITPAAVGAGYGSLQAGQYFDFRFLPVGGGDISLVYGYPQP